MSAKSRLSELEHEVMNVLWSRREATAAHIQSALAERRPLKDSTIRTVLTRLENKGYVQHEVDGRTFIYQGVERPGRVAGRAVKQILDRFCHGSLESLLAGMVDDELVDAEELRRITERLAREHAGKTPEDKLSRKK